MADSQIITPIQAKQFQDDGFFILEAVLDEQQISILRDACDTLIEAMHQEMDRLDTDHIHISHRGQRYHIAKQYHLVPALEQIVFSDLMADICRATIGPDAYPVSYTHLTLPTTPYV